MDFRDVDGLFEDRAHAGRQLGIQLQRYRADNPLIMALPRGGVAVGFEVASVLDAELDVLVARKLGAPRQPELGIGAIAPFGVRVLDSECVRWLGITLEMIDRIAARETLEMERRQKEYRGDKPFPKVADRTVILVDDGIATGVTVRAAVMCLRKLNVKRLILGAPVCAPDTAQTMRRLVDEAVFLYEPPVFYAVGMWYRNFDQLSDQEVEVLLGRNRRIHTRNKETNV